MIGKQTPETLLETVEAQADGKTYKVSNVKSSGDKAMLYKEKERKKTKRRKRKKRLATMKNQKMQNQDVVQVKKPAQSDEKKAKVPEFLFLHYIKKENQMVLFLF